MSTSPSRAVKLFGTDVPADPPRTLRAGPLTAELGAGNLRYIRVAGREAIRAIAFVVRDSIWGTYNPAIENLAVEQSPDGFSVRYDASCGDDRQSLRFTIAITGTADGRLGFEADVEPVSDFESRRVGFVVLHALDGVVGRPAEILHTDGRTEHSVFPELIEPWQPFFDIRALGHEIAPGLRVTCTMEGDQYETEDHRNWTDASFKTYIRPLAKPAPFVMPAGERTRQSVTLTLIGDVPAAGDEAGAGGPIRIAVGPEAGTMPRIGIGVHPRRAAATLAAADLVSLLGARVLICHYDPRDGHGRSDLARFQALGEALGADVSLEAIVPCDGDYREEIRSLRARVDESGVQLAALAVAPGPDLIAGQPFSDWPSVPPLGDLYDAAREAFPGIPIGGGSFSYFTELNRRRPPADRIDFLCHATAALVHAADDVSIMETLEALPDVIATADSIRAGKPYHVGPAAIASRHSPFGGAPAPNENGERITMVRLDPRQRGLLGAAWHLGYLARMVAGGVDQVAMSSAVGEFGLVYQPLEWAQPWYDEGAGAVYPAFHVLRGAAAASGTTALQVTSAVPRDVLGFAHLDGGERVLWLANLTGGPREVALEELAGTDHRVSVLDEATFEACVADAAGFDATERPLEGTRLALAAYAVVRIRSR